MRLPFRLAHQRQSSCVYQTQNADESYKEKDLNLFIVQEKLKIFNNKILEASNRLKEVKVPNKNSQKSIEDLYNVLESMSKEHIVIVEKLENLKKKLQLKK